MATIEDLEAGLKINRFDLDEDRASHAELYWMAAEAASLERSRLDEAEANLKLIEAELDDEIRERCDEEGKKFTEKFIDMEIRRHPKRIKGHKDYLAKKYLSERFDQLRESYKQRSFMLRAMSADSERALDERSVYISREMDRKRKMRT